jgi:hypothetical protein
MSVLGLVTAPSCLGFIAVAVITFLIHCQFLVPSS